MTKKILYCYKNIIKNNIFLQKLLNFINNEIHMSKKITIGMIKFCKVNNSRKEKFLFKQKKLQYSTYLCNTIRANAEIDLQKKTSLNNVIFFYKNNGILKVISLIKENISYKLKLLKKLMFFKIDGLLNGLINIRKEYFTNKKLLWILLFFFNIGNNNIYCKFDHELKIEVDNLEAKFNHNPEDKLINKSTDEDKENKNNENINDDLSVFDIIEINNNNKKNEIEINNQIVNNQSIIKEQYNHKIMSILQKTIISGIGIFLFCVAIYSIVKKNKEKELLEKIARLEKVLKSLELLQSKQQLENLVLSLENLNRLNVIIDNITTDLINDEKSKIKTILNKKQFLLQLIKNNKDIELNQLILNANQLEEKIELIYNRFIPLEPLPLNLLQNKETFTLLQKKEHQLNTLKNNIEESREFNNDLNIILLKINEMIKNFFNYMILEKINKNDKKDKNNIKDINIININIPLNKKDLQQQNKINIIQYDTTQEPKAIEQYIKNNNNMIIKEIILKDSEFSQQQKQNIEDFIENNFNQEYYDNLEKNLFLYLINNSQQKVLTEEIIPLIIINENQSEFFFNKNGNYNRIFAKKEDIDKFKNIARKQLIINKNNEAILKDPEQEFDGMMDKLKKANDIPIINKDILDETSDIRKYTDKYNILYNALNTISDGTNLYKKILQNTNLIQGNYFSITISNKNIQFYIEEVNLTNSYKEIIFSFYEQLNNGFIIKKIFTIDTSGSFRLGTYSKYFYNKYFDNKIIFCYKFFLYNTLYINEIENSIYSFFYKIFIESEKNKKIETIKLQNLCLNISLNEVVYNEIKIQLLSENNKK